MSAVLFDPHYKGLTPDLLAKAQKLKASPLFVNPSTGAELLEKWQIFLVLAGCKPVSEVASGHWVEVPGGRQTVADDPKQVGALLQSLGLHYHLSDLDGHATGAIVALTPETLDKYLHASGSSSVGELFGYPKTAVKAFEQGESALLPVAEQEQREREAGLPDILTTFRLSRNHWADELNVVKAWFNVLSRASLLE